MAPSNCPISSGRDKKLLANGSCANTPSTAPTCSCLALLPLPQLSLCQGRGAGEWGIPDFPKVGIPKSAPLLPMGDGADFGILTLLKGAGGAGRGHPEEQVPLVPSLCPSPAQPQIKAFSSILCSILPRPAGWLLSALSAFLPSSRECVSWMG